MNWHHRGTAASFGLAVLTASLLPANAADLGGGPPRRPTEYAAPTYVAEPVYNRWSGFYIGGALGYNFETTSTGGDIGSYSFENSGTNGLLLAGVNWQAGRLVLGIEADVGLGQLGGNIATTSGTLERDVQAFGSLRARAGMLLTPALLVYATGGLAWANMDMTLAGETTNFTAYGYQIGGGAELAISDRVALRLEYIYTDLGKDKVEHLGLSNSFDTQSHAVRAGVTFKF